jgi:hypothetical protein
MTNAFIITPKPVRVRTVNDNLESLTIDDIVNHKQISDEALRKDLMNLNDFPGTENANNFAGNPFLYHFQFPNLLHCTRERSGRPRDTIYDIWADPVKRAELIDQTRKRNRGGKVPANNVFEAYRINTGSIVMFKAITAKYLYKKYRAKKVLDPTAGWGGRMLGAWSLGIDYVGIDTNTEMKPAYDGMIDYLENFNFVDNPLFEEKSPSHLEMIWDSCLAVDFTKIDYDFVLTSPPYINMELYRKMKPWENDQAFYCDFFIPLWAKCIDNIKKGGHVCFNISPKMYDDAIKHGLPECDAEEDLLQQLGQAKGKKKQDKIYIWNC